MPSETAPAEVPFIRPSFPGPEEVAEDITDIVQSNWYANFGEREGAFAAALAEYLGQGLHAATFANGTLALVAAVQSIMDRGDGSRFLLMPSFTFVAVAQAAIWNGYRPWFVDIDPTTLQASTDSALGVLENARDRVAGVLLPNAFGVGNPRIDDWERLAAEWELPVVIDSAAGFGSRYADGHHLGGHGSCEIFSFHATKPFAIGEGGALVSRDPSVVSEARDFQNFGFDDSRQSRLLGLNAKLTEIGAAIGLRQLAGFDARLASRRAVFDRYRTELGGLGIGFQANAETSSLCFATICCPSAEDAGAVSGALRNDRIGTRNYYNPPVHRQSYFRSAATPSKSTELSVTESVCSRVVSLPIHDHMETEHVDRVVTAVHKAMTR